MRKIAGKEYYTPGALSYTHGISIVVSCDMQKLFFLAWSVFKAYNNTCALLGSWADDQFAASFIKKLGRMLACAMDKLKKQSKENP